MSAKSCNLYPIAAKDNKHSKLYKRLLEKTNNRPLTNYLYVSYLQPGVADTMDQDTTRYGKRGDQDEHSAEAVYDFFNVVSMLNQRNAKTSVEKAIGARDQNNNVIFYDDPNEALKKANDFNQGVSQEKSVGLVASVGQTGDKFCIIVDYLDSKTITTRDKVKEQIKLWDIVRDFFKQNGMDLDNMPFLRSRANPVQGGEYLVNYLNSLKNFIRGNLISKQDIMTILYLEENSNEVKRLKQAYGELEDVADAIYNSYRDPSSMTASKKSLRDTVLENGRNLGGIDLNALKALLKKESKDFREESPDWGLKEAYDKMAEEYDLEAIELVLKEEITTLSEAAGEALIILKRRMDKAKDLGDTAEGKRLQELYKTMARELASQQFYQGSLNFLQETLTQLDLIQEILNNVQQTGTALERSISKAKAVTQIKELIEGHYKIVDALTRMDQIIIDENISASNKKNIEQLASQVKNSLDARRSLMKQLQKEITGDMAVAILGDKLPDKRAVTELLDAIEKGTGVSDFLYSMSRCSDPLVAAMGTIVRDAQDQRTLILQDLRLRIRRVTEKLYKSGSNSEFMYDETNHFISDIDWASYEIAKEKYRKNLFKKRPGGKRYDYWQRLEKMDEWIDNNTEERVVDKKTGRTERVPNHNYRTDWDKSQLTDAQQKYYDEIMQIKGELGSLIPEFAQNHYLPPQVRMSNGDQFRKGRVWKATKDKVKDMWTIREDETDYQFNGTVMGESAHMGRGDLSGVTKKDVPIFYLHELEDQRELLKDASGAIERFATTAINYYAISRVKDVVESMADYIKDMRPSQMAKDGKAVYEQASAEGVVVSKKLMKTAKKWAMVHLINAFIDQEIYGIRKRGNSKVTRFFDKLTQYTSIKSLALNTKGMVANELAGEIQMLIEATAGEFYNIGDLAWAHAKLLGSWNSIGRIFGFLFRNKNSKITLIAELLDITGDDFSESKGARYHKNWLVQLLGGDFSFMGYKAGEQIIHIINALAMLKHHKVLVNGKKTSLWNALRKSKKIDGNSQLLLAKNTTDLNGNVIDIAYLNRFKGEVRYVNQTCHGSMNAEDKGVIHQYVVGRMLANFRQWAVEHYSRRFRKQHFDGSIKQFREGYYNTLGRFVYGLLPQMFEFQARAAIKWGDMDRGQRKNVIRALAEMVLITGLLSGIIAFMGDPDDHKGENAWRFWQYILRRLRMETFGSMPIGWILESKTLLNSPIASTNTVNGLIYPLFSYKDWDRTLQSGPHRGENAFWVNLKRYTIPFIKDIDQTFNFGEDEAVFRLFDPENMYK